MSFNKFYVLLTVLLDIIV